MLKQYLEIGKIVSTHGLRGDLKVEPWCDTPDYLCGFKKLYTNDGSKVITIESAKVHKTLVIIHIDGIDTVEAADTMRNTVLFMDRNDAEIEDGAYFIQDLIGMKVIDADSGNNYGTLTDVIKTGANDVYEVTDANGKKYLVPVIPDVVIEIDIDSEIVKLRPIKGIFDDED